MGGREVPIKWQGRMVKAWVPNPLTVGGLQLSEANIRSTEQAAWAVRLGNDRLPERWEPLVRLLLRTEGVASSFIEGVRASLADVAAAELDPSVGVTAAWVADNLAAVSAAIDEARRGKPLKAGSLHRWHRTLMAGSSRLPPSLIGAFRKAQGWIGGTSPLDAALVTTPPEYIEELMGDLIAFVNRSDVDAVTQAAIAHAQFEIIHPYGDGNGRVGRVLIGWILSRRLNLTSPPPVSVMIAGDRRGYLSGLTLFRLGNLDPWVSWFAQVVRRAGDATAVLAGAIGELEARWMKRLAGLRAGAAATKLLAVLPEHPVISAASASASLGVSERACRNALRTLAGHGIVQPFHPQSVGAGRPHHWWVATELIDLVTGWSRQ